MKNIANFFSPTWRKLLLVFLLTVVTFVGLSQTILKRENPAGPGKSKAAAILDVKTFGAKGDGTTDDSAALQNAANALPAYGELYIPAGTYKGVFNLNGKSNILVRGDGTTSVVKSPLGKGQVIGVYSSNNVTMRDFNVVGDYSMTTQRGIGVFGLTTGTFERVSLSDIGFCGIFSNGTFTDVLFKDVNVKKAGDFGIQFKVGADRVTVDGGSFTDFASRLYPAHGVYSEGAKNVTVKNTYSARVMDAPNMYEVSGIKITETSTALVENNVTEDSVAGVSVPGSTGVVVKNNVWRRNSKRGAYILAGSSGVTFDNNRIEGAPIGFSFDHYSTWPSNITLKNNNAISVTTPVSAGSTTGLVQTNNSWQPGYVSTTTTLPTSTSTTTTSSTSTTSTSTTTTSTTTTTTTTTRPVTTTLSSTTTIPTTTTLPLTTTTTIPVTTTTLPQNFLSVSFLAPPDGSRVSGKTNFKVYVNTNLNISKVDLYIDGVLRSTDRKYPYYFSVNTSNWTSGSHTIRAVAYTTNGLTASKTITVVK